MIPTLKWNRNAGVFFEKSNKFAYFALKNQDTNR